MSLAKFDTEMFIWEIQNRPALWDVNSDDYSRPDKKKQCWEALVDIFSEEDADENERKTCGMLLQKKWKNLRGCYTRELLRQRSAVNSSSKRKKNYIYFNHLSFLNESVGKIRKVKQDSLNKNSDDSLSVADQKSSDDSEEHSDSEIYYYKQTQLISKRNVGSDEDPLSTSTQNNLTQAKRTVPECDEERLFLLSLVKPLQRVPEEDRLSVQIEILNVINNAIKNSQSPS